MQFYAAVPSASAFFLQDELKLTKKYITIFSTHVFTRNCEICYGRKPNLCLCEFESDSFPVLHSKCSVFCKRILSGVYLKYIPDFILSVSLILSEKSAPQVLSFVFCRSCLFDDLQFAEIAVIVEV